MWREKDMNVVWNTLNEIRNWFKLWIKKKRRAFIFCPPTPLLSSSPSFTNADPSFQLHFQSYGYNPLLSPRHQPTTATACAAISDDNQSLQPITHRFFLSRLSSCAHNRIINSSLLYIVSLRSLPLFPEPTPFLSEITSSPSTSDFAVENPFGCRWDFLPLYPKT